MKSVTVRMSEALFEQAREFAHEHGTTLNQLIRDLLAREVVQGGSQAIERLFSRADRLSLRSEGTDLARGEANWRGDKWPTE